ncbi:RND transporter [Bacillus sinesaloumensis]|uniref:RND transporter n=1 Tax=Litchfieldia sinesaloumensis TaxID=1926280 RepID=UPI0009886D23|nr:RND transporter [Bacillus sinesaloumensis]
MEIQINKKVLNWTVFTLVLLAAIITITSTVYDLYYSPGIGEAAQSRLGFRWGTIHLIISVILLLFSGLLAINWKRMFPFNIPVAIILVGFYYELFFLTFTIGWVGALGMFGFVIAFLIGATLIISYSIANLLDRRKSIIKN